MIFTETQGNRTKIAHVLATVKSPRSEKFLIHMREQQVGAEICLNSMVGLIKTLRRKV